MLSVSLDTFEVLAVYVARWEGCTSWFYLDTAGVCTIGKGLAVFSAAEAARLFGPDARAAWESVRTAPPGLVAESYAHLSDWRASDAVLEKEFRSRLMGVAIDLSRQFETWNQTPANAQIALIDLAYNVGAAKLPDRWPNLARAVREGNWLEASAQCVVTKGAPDVKRQRARQLLFSSLLVPQGDGAEGNA